MRNSDVIGTGKEKLESIERLLAEKIAPLADKMEKPISFRKNLPVVRGHGIYAIPFSPE